MASSFIPKGQEGLLLRSPLTYGFSSSSVMRQPMPIYTKDFDKTHVLGPRDQEVLAEMGTPRNLGFYTRNNPHPVRVRHMKGLLDAPICFVEDRSHERFLLSAPSGQDFGPSYRPPGSTRYSANTAKSVPAVGVVPVTNAWRDELEKKTQNAILRAMGQGVPPSRAGLTSRSGQRQPNQFDYIHDEKLLDLLCKILQTGSIPSCQAWLSMASDNEKNIVLNMIRMAASGEIQDPNAISTRPQTSESQFRYIWAPEQSQTQHRRPDSHLYDDDTEFDFDCQQGEREMGGLFDDESAVPFKYPEHDTIIKTARQLSGLASRQGSRAGRGLEFDVSNHGNYHHLNDTNAGKKSLLAQKLQMNMEGDSYNRSRHRSKQHSRSASLSATMPTGHLRSAGSSLSRRSRSKSANVQDEGNRLGFPPPPVKLSVTKETIRTNTAGSGKARLRFTSHCDT